MIQVLNRAFDILEILAKEPQRERSLTEIADALELNHGTCANILKTLVQRKYVEQVGHKKGYLVGVMAYTLTNNNAYKKDMVQAVMPLMQGLTEKLNENTLFAILKDDKRLVLCDMQSNHDLLVRTSKEKSAYESSTGRLLLAYLSEEALAKFIEKYGLPRAEIWEESAAEEGLKATLKRIKKDGFAMQVSPKQIVGIAVPLFKDNVFVASLGVFLPESRFRGEFKKVVMSEIKNTAKQINLKL
jgi:IclR family transcriptional regulator, KDG regulon repressor